MYASRWRSCASVRLYTHASVLTPSVYFCLSTCPDANTESNRDTTWRRRLRTSGSREQTLKCFVHRSGSEFVHSIFCEK